MYKKFLTFLFLFVGLSFFSIVSAETINTQDVTWYYRQMTDESTLLNTTKDINTYIYLASNSNSAQEYLNGYTTRVSSSFLKDNLYSINYTLTMYYNSGNDGNFRSDTIERMNSYAYIDSDFSLINSVVNQVSYWCNSGICERIFSVSLTVKALNNTNAIRFGVYTNENKSIGFYSHYIGGNGASTIAMYISPTTNVLLDNSTAIVDQNNTIIDQNNTIINNNNQNTQDIIDNTNRNFQDCHQSYNLYDNNSSPSGTSITRYNNGFTLNKSSNRVLRMNLPTTLSAGNYTLSYDIISAVLSDNNSFGLWLQLGNDNTSVGSSIFLNKNSSTTFNAEGDFNKLYFFINNSEPSNSNITIDNIMLVKGSSAKPFEPYGEEVCVNRLDEQTNAINGLNDSLNDDNSSGAQSEASDFFSNFNTNTFGLTSIITAPLNLIQSITSSSCSSLHLPLPYLTNKYLDLPCMSTIYSQYFGSFFTLYQTITYGIIAYWVCVRIFNQVKDFKNPEHDEIEVLDL